jgi:inhibitor of cysteine peptidase
MRLKIVLLLLAVLAGAISSARLLGQSSSDGQAQPVMGNRQEGGNHARVIGEADNGKDITVAKGTPLVIRLVANPTTGYSWQLGGDPAPLALESTKFQSNNADKKLVGSPQVQVMQFKTGNPGTASLILEYRRPWEKNVAAAKTFKVQVIVQ